MTITLQDYASGDTNYVSKLNSNNDVLEAAIDSLQTATSAGGSATVSVPTAYAALFGSTVALIGAASYACTDAGSGNLSVASGYCYRPSLIAVVSKGTSTTLAFTGLTAATYYIVVGSTGTPERTDSSTEAIYSVVWTGSAFGAITRLAAIVWGASDWIAAQTSTALSASYTTLDARFEAIESLAGGGSQSANTIYAGPTAGGAAAPAFRALVQADLPTQPYDVGGSYPSAPTASLVMVRYPFPRAVSFPSSLTNSRGVAGTAATAQTDFDLKKNGVSFGTMRFAAAGTTASFIAASSSSFAAGDILTVVAPATPDATLAGIGFSLAGTR